ncbi:MAG: site-2 protease family protein [Candidatus Saganbacteria bacterium]|nr:site-2 protease family protein [Candidatus Saganbacteria bacterium]
MKFSFKLITILGIPISINASWFITFGLVLISFAMGWFPIYAPGLSDLAYWTMGIVSALLLFTSLLAHELSHSYVAIKHNLPIKGITLFIFGGVAHMTKEPSDPKTEFKMAIAGPACSVAIAATLGILTILFEKLGFPVYISAITLILSKINIWIAIFNLVPGFPLDGGRVFRAILWAILKDLKRATQIASTGGKAVASLLIAAGFLSLIYGSTLSGVWFILIGWFLWEAAGLSYQQVVMKKVLTGARVSDIMSRNVVSVEGNTSLHDLVEEYFFKYRYTSFPVISAGELKGLITLHDVKDVPRGEWPVKTAEEVMDPINEDLVIKENAQVLDALTQMAKTGIGRLLVIEDSRLIGIISQRDIVRLFEFRADLGES